MGGLDSSVRLFGGSNKCLSDVVLAVVKLILRYLKVLAFRAVELAFSGDLQTTACCVESLSAWCRQSTAETSTFKLIMEFTRRQFIGKTAAAVIVAGTMAHGKVFGAND